MGSNGNSYDDEIRELAGSTGIPRKRELNIVLRKHTAVNSRAETCSLEFKQGFDGKTRAWCELLKDMVAMANSGGGIILFGVDRDSSRIGLPTTLTTDFDPANITNKIGAKTKATIQTAYCEIRYYGQLYGFLLVRPNRSLVIFDKNGDYQGNDGKTRQAFSKGVIYVRKPGCNSECSQSELNRLVSEAVQRETDAFLARIDKVAHLPSETELIVSDRTGSDRAYVLVDSGKGIPIRLVKTGSRKAIPVREILKADVPFSTLDDEIKMATRLWEQGKGEYRADCKSLIGWYLRRREFEITSKVAEFGFISSGYCHGFPMFWASEMGSANLRKWIDDEAHSQTYPMNRIVPYVVGAFFWKERKELLDEISKRVPGFSNSLVDRISTMSSRGEFRTRIRMVAKSIHLEGRKILISDLMKNADRAREVYDQLLTEVRIGKRDSVHSTVAHQLDIFLHAPK